MLNYIKEMVFDCHPEPDCPASAISRQVPSGRPLAGNHSTCSESQERFWIHPPKADKSQNNRNMELRQRPQGVIFIKNSSS